LLKDRVADVTEFLDALRRVAAGGSALDPEVVAQLLARSRHPIGDLTPREREVLALMAEGRSNAAIAQSLVVGGGAVEKHINNIFTKLGLAPGDDRGNRRVLAVLSYLAIESSGGSGAGSGGAGGAGGIASGRLHMTPGRVAALTIGVPIVLAMIGWLSLTLVALLDMESFPVNVTIPVAGKQLTAQIDGNVTVRQQAGVSNGKLTGIAKYNLIRPSVTTSRTATGWRVGYRCDIGVG